MNSEKNKMKLIHVSLKLQIMYSQILSNSYTFAFRHQSVARLIKEIPELNFYIFFRLSVAAVELALLHLYANV